MRYSTIPGTRKTLENVYSTYWPALSFILKVPNFTRQSFLLLDVSWRSRQKSP